MTVGLSSHKGEHAQRLPADMPATQDLVRCFVEEGIFGRKQRSSENYWSHDGSRLASSMSPEPERQSSSLYGHRLLSAQRLKTAAGRGHSIVGDDAVFVSLDAPHSTHEAHVRAHCPFNHSGGHRIPRQLPSRRHRSESRGWTRPSSLSSSGFRLDCCRTLKCCAQHLTMTYRSPKLGIRN